MSSLQRGEFQRVPRIAPDVPVAGLQSGFGEEEVEVFKDGVTAYDDLLSKIG
jgi:hypothetical protein